MKTAITEGRGKSVYDTLTETGWRPIKAPSYMRSYDCFRFGRRHAYVTSARHADESTTFYFAVEVGVQRDLFNRWEWKPIGVVAFDGNASFEFRTAMACEYHANNAMEGRL